MSLPTRWAQNHHQMMAMAAGLVVMVGMVVVCVVVMIQMP
jgi:hypothetical protein